MHKTEIRFLAETPPDNCAPTAQAYGELYGAVKVFNQLLFNSQLPQCLITLQRRSKRTYGYFSAGRFGSTRESVVTTDEIAMNPTHFKSRSARETLGTLGHELVHHWQQHFGKPSRGGYHNKEWAAKMLSIGLHPSSTGRPGGRMTGQRVSHYIIPGSAIGIAIDFLLENGWGLSWYDRAADEVMMLSGPSPGAPLASQARSIGRIKYCCRACELNAWAKPTANLMCGDCRLLMLPERRPSDSHVASA